MISRRKNIIGSILLVVALIAMPLQVVLADNYISVLQTHVTEQTLTVFTNAEMDADSLQCVISNQNAEIMSYGLLSEENALTRTTILLDISESTPENMQRVILGLLNTLIEQKATNEEFRVVAFGDEIVTLQDFAVDRFDIDMALRDISFEDTESRVFDAVFNTIPNIAPFDDTPIFYRTILITHGVDNAASEITSEELFIRLQNERYPVDVVAVSKNAEQEVRELSAIARMSGGRHFPLIEDTDTTELAESLEVGSFFYFQATVPPALLDGTTRQVDIADGTNSISIDIRFPVFSNLDESSPVPSEPNATGQGDEPELEQQEQAEIAGPLDETSDTGTFLTMLGDNTVIVLIIIGIILTTAIVLIIYVVSRNKNKNASSQPSSAPMLTPAFEQNFNSHIEKTDFLSEGSAEWTQYKIKISEVTNPNEAWTLPVNDGLIIGRAKHCAIQLNDKSVGREQCKIIVQGATLAIEHIGATNKTYLNGQSVIGSVPLQSGNIITVGRKSLRIDYIQALGNQHSNFGQPQQNTSGHTESVF